MQSYALSPTWPNISAKKLHLFSKFFLTRYNIGIYEDGRWARKLGRLDEVSHVEIVGNMWADENRGSRTRTAAP